ncbi:hypothetical protein R1sor_014945 [Riccia sorocarpa]|uniref:Pentatricopeptide repeat-containing protein n=1 Tax=Riccia sorocarpa TaxID=122646 RepID=A0ABD3HCP2_9MARC
MFHPAAAAAAFQSLSFSSVVGKWRPNSVETWRCNPPSSSVRSRNCRCSLENEITPYTHDSTQKIKEELTRKELHYLRKKKERKILRKRKKELLEKERLAELAKLPVVKPNYAIRRFSKNFDTWNKPRKKKNAVSSQDNLGVEASTSGVEFADEVPTRMLNSWSEFEEAYRERLKNLTAGNESFPSSTEAGAVGQNNEDSDGFEAHQSVSEFPRPEGSEHLREPENEIKCEKLEAEESETAAHEESGSSDGLSEQGIMRQVLRSEVEKLVDSVGRASDNKKTAKLLVGQRNGAPVYLSTEDEDGLHRRHIQRADMMEQKQLDWLAKQLNSVNRADGVHFSRLMRSSGLKITDGRAVILLQSLGARGNWRRALQVVKWLSSRHHYPPMKSRYVYTTLLAVLNQSRRPVEALKVFKDMCEDTEAYPDMAAYHSVAVTLGQAGFLEELLDLIAALRRGLKNIKWDLKLENYGVLDPDLVIFNAVLNACVPHKEWKCALWVLDEIRKKKLRPNSASYGLAIEVMVKAGKLNLAFDLLEVMENDRCLPNSLTYRVLVEGLGQAGQPDKALALVKRMEERGIVPSPAVYFALASTLCTCGRWKEAILQVGRLMEVSDKPLVETYTGLITACEKAGHWRDAISVFRFMQEVCAPNIGTCNVMIALYGRHKLFAEAKHLFESLQAGPSNPQKKYKNASRLSRNKFTYDAMLGACVVSGEWESLETTYEQMLLHGFELKSERHGWILGALVNAGKHELVESMFARMLRSQNEAVSAEVYRIIIYSFITVRRDEEAFRWLEEMVKQTMTISDTEFRKFQEAACSLHDADRQRFLDLLSSLQVSSVFNFERSDKSVSSGDQSSVANRLNYQQLRASMLTDEQTGRTRYRQELRASFEDGNEEGSHVEEVENSEERRKKGNLASGEDSASSDAPVKGRKKRRPKKPVYTPDPEIPGWELLWTGLDQKYKNQMDLSVFH